MKQLSKIAKALAISLVCGAAASANATPIIGLANLTFGNVLISLNEIDWNPPTNPGVDALRTYGEFRNNTVSNTGSFLSLPSLSLGNIQDMSNNPVDANYVPLGTQTPAVPNFLQFSTQPNWKFDLTYLVPGDTLGAPSPYVLTQLGNNVSATISMNGLACDTGGDAICDVGEDVTAWTGIFSAQYTNTTIAGLAGILLAGGTLDNNTWSGTIEATRMPEPGSLALAGLALVGLGASLRRRKA